MTAPLEYDIGATPVENLVRWITSDAEGSFTLPTTRGDDLVIPGLAGEVDQPRVLGPSFDEFTVRVSGLNTDGTPAADSCAQFHRNMRDLRQLLFTTTAALSVTKRIFYPAPTGTVTYGPTTARCVGFTPRFESNDFAVVLIRLKIHNGWAGVL